MVENEDIKSKIDLREIKSSYIKNIIISFLNEKQKLEIIKYSKELQKICLIGIEDYKKKSGKYKIGGKNGKGKEYTINTKKLIFEGEYLNGTRKGYVKEYNYDGNLIFDGEYLNGTRNGKGKDYYNNGNLRFEGEYLNGKRNGKGKEYNYNGNLIFEGEYLNNLNKKGREYINGKLEFEREYLNNKKMKWKRI